MDCTCQQLPGTTDGASQYVSVDLTILTVVVNMRKAKAYSDELINILADWPTSTPARRVPQLEHGQNYLQIGAVLEDQQASIHLIALGHALGIWKAEKPTDLDVSEATARFLEESGCIFIFDINLDVGQEA